MDRESGGAGDTGATHLEKILPALEHARADAWLRRDKRALSALLASDFVEINSLGRFPKKEILGQLFPALILREFRIENPVVRETGPGTAVIRYRCHQVFSFGGRVTEGTFHVTASYALRDGRYRLVAWEIAPAA